MDALVGGLLKPDVDPEDWEAQLFDDGTAAATDSAPPEGLEVGWKPEDEEESEEEEDSEEAQEEQEMADEEEKSEEDVEGLLEAMESEDAAGLAAQMAETPERLRSSRTARRFDRLFRELTEIRVLLQPLMTAAAATKPGDEGDREAAVAALRSLVSALLDAKAATQADEEPPAEQASLEEMWADIEMGRKRRRPGWEAAMEAWRRRTQLGKASAKLGLTAVNVGPFEAARRTLDDDRERALKKMHPMVEGVLDRETYDDAALYRTMVRDAVDAAPSADRSSLVPEAAEMSTGRAKETGKRKASKGRRLEFETHEKLLNFMSPVPRPQPLWNVEMLFQERTSQPETPGPETPGFTEEDLAIGPALFAPE